MMNSNDVTTPGRRPGRPSKQATAENPPKRVEPVIINNPVIGIRHTPCCGRAVAPKLVRSRISESGTSRVSEAKCTLCNHRLRITYELRKGEWMPVSARDLTRQPITELPENPSVKA